MNPAKFSIEKKVISWMLVLIFGVGGPSEEQIRDLTSMQTIISGISR